MRTSKGNQAGCCGLGESGHGPPLHVAWGCSPDPRHRPEKTELGLGLRLTPRATPQCLGKREEPSLQP